MSASMALSEREAGDILRRVMHLEDGMKELRSEVRGIDGKVDGILARFDRIDGGMKIAMAVSGFAGALFMFFLPKALAFFFSLFPRI